MTTLTRHFQVPEFNLLRREMDRLFNDFQSEPSSETTDTLMWMPRADLSESEESFLLSVDLPGVSPNDVEVTLEDDTLTISGQRESSAQSTDGRFHRVERQFGRFIRTLRFAVPVEGDSIEATFDNGVLHVTVPKAESSKPRRIEVRPSGRQEITSGDGSSDKESAVNVEFSDTNA